MPQKDQFKGFNAMVQMKHSNAETLMLQRDGIAGTPRLNFESWRALLRSNCGGEVQVTAPNVFLRKGTLVAMFTGGPIGMFASMARTIISFCFKSPGSRP